MDLEGKTAIVTGGSRGIGYAIAEAFVGAGARVVISARGKEALDEAAKRLGPNAIAIPCDVSDPAAVGALVSEASRLGLVDVLVNNAGISPFYKRVEHTTAEELDQLMGVNLRGAWCCGVEVATRLFEAGRPGRPRSLIRLNTWLQRITPAGAYLEVTGGLAATDRGGREGRVLPASTL